MRRSAPPLGFLLRKLDNLIDSQFEVTIGDRNVSRRQWQLLNVLMIRPATIAEINQALAPFVEGATEAEVGSSLDSLIERGAVGDVDGAFQLTDAGSELLEDLRGDVQQTRELAVRNLAEGEYERTIGTLTVMISNLDSRA